MAETRLKQYARFLEAASRNAQDTLAIITPKVSPGIWSQYVRDLREPCIRELMAYRSSLGRLYEIFPELRPKKSSLDRM
jgi:hypothetical protein